LAWVQKVVKSGGIGNGCHPIPLGTGLNGHIGLKCRHLPFVHQPGVVVLVTGKRCAPAFDRIGQKGRWPVMIHARECRGHGFHALATEVVHQGCQFFIRTAVKQG